MVYLLGTALTVLLFSTIIIFPQSYGVAKQIILVVYLVFNLFILSAKRQFLIDRSDILFYVIVILIGLIWSLIGLIKQNDFGGIFAGLKLYVAWSFVFLLVVTMHRNLYELRLFHVIFVLSGLAIAFINLLALYDVFFQANIIPTSVINELGLFVGLHGGYIKIHSNNIASLFFITGYLVAYKIHWNSTGSMPRLTSAALVLCLIVSALSGRRALWIAVVLMPFVVLLLIILMGDLGKIWRHLRLVIVSGFALIATGISVLYMRGLNSVDFAFLEYFYASFSIEDERSIQKGYLIDSFVEHSVLGSGFGGYAGYTRSAELPWLYELTFHQLLFNLGLVGVAIVGALFLVYSLRVMNAIRRDSVNAAILLGTLTGFYMLLVGSYSNPYFQFFDGIFFIAMFVYIAGFNDKASTKNEVAT